MSSSALEIPIQPGYVSAILFILFDLVVLSLLDKSFASILSHAYYAHIFRHGVPIRVRAVDIPSVTSNVVGDSIINPRINAVVLVIKLLVLAAILAVDLSLDSRMQPRFDTRAYSSTFGFDASDAAWPYDVGTPLRIVERRWAASRRCFSLINGGDNDEDEVEGGEGVEKKNNERLDFYPLVFNLTTNPSTGAEVVVENESIVLQSIQDALSVNFVALNDTSLQCTSPSLTMGAVPTQDNNSTDSSTSATSSAMPPLASVTGCSDHPFQNFSQCYAMSKRNVSVSLSFNVTLSEYYRYEQTLLEGDGRMTFQVFKFPSSVWSSFFPASYSSSATDSEPTLTCSRSSFGVSRTDSTLRTWCLFYVPGFADENSTMLEVWRYPDERENDNRTVAYMTRTYAGPVFEGIVPFGVFQTVSMLLIADRLADFATLASVAVAESTVYTRFQSPLQVAVRGKSYTLTLIPWFAVAVVVVLAAATVAACAAAAVLRGGDERPLFNTVDGLSSIAREERRPTQASLVKGGPCTLAISDSGSGMGVGKMVVIG